MANRKVYLVEPRPEADNTASDWGAAQKTQLRLVPIASYCNFTFNSVVGIVTRYFATPTGSSTSKLPSMLGGPSCPPRNITEEHKRPLRYATTLLRRVAGPLPSTGL